MFWTDVIDLRGIDCVKKNVFEQWSQSNVKNEIDGK
jgi:hypothetical protein